MVLSAPRIILCAFAASLTVISPSNRLLAQDPVLQQRSAAPPGATVLQTGTQLVVIDVTVKDKSGHPVHGLKREDFLLEESRKPQNIRAFDEQMTSPTPAVIPSVPKLPPGSFTDYTPVPSKSPLNILLIDGLNTPLADQSYLFQQVSEYLRHITPGTRIAVVGLSTHLYLLQGFTSDPTILKNVFGSIKNGKPSPLLSTTNSPVSNSALLDSLTDNNAPGGATSSAAGESALMTNNASNFLEQLGVSQIAQRSQYTLEAFTTLGHWLANFPGRKNVLWFSGAFPLDVVPNASIQNNTDIPGEQGDYFRAMTNLLTKAQVSVYPIDPRGVQVDSTFEAAGGTNLHPPSFSDSLSADFNQRTSEHAAMQAIASDTGGEPFYNGNNLSDAISAAINEGANYYTLAYTPSEHKTGGEWRSIHIELSPDASHRGLHLSYRRGYFAENLNPHSDKKIGSASLSTAAFTPQAEGHNYARAAMTRGAPTPTDILFTTRVLPHSTTTSDTPAASNVLDPKAPITAPFLNFDVDTVALPRYFTLTQQPNGNYTGAIELAVFVYSTDGKLINTTAKKLTLDFTPDIYAHFLKSPVGIHVEVSTPAKSDSILRIGLQDLASNRIGAVEVPTAAVRNLAPAN